MVRGVRRSASVDPVTSLMHVGALVRAGRAAEAMEQLSVIQNAATLPPEWASAIQRRSGQLRRALTFRAEAHALASLGRMDEARRKYRRAKDSLAAGGPEMTVEFTGPTLVGKIHLWAWIQRAADDLLAETLAVINGSH